MGQSMKVPVAGAQGMRGARGGFGAARVSLIRIECADMRQAMWGVLL